MDLPGQDAHRLTHRRLRPRCTSEFVPRCVYRSGSLEAVMAVIPTSNVISRVFKIYGIEGHGTAFTIEVEDVQFLVTARHILPDSSHVTIGLEPPTGSRVNLTLARLDVQPLGADIAVLVLPEPISPTWDLVPTMDGSVQGQEVCFLGYPFDLALRSEMGGEMRTYPFVKGGILSAWAVSSSGIAQVFLDGMNNPGFSGGPVVFQNLGSGKLHVGAVIQGFRGDRASVMIGDTPTNGHVVANTGVVVATRINHAVEAIQRYLTTGAHSPQSA